MNQQYNAGPAYQGNYPPQGYPQYGMADTSPLTTGQFIGMFIIMAIPLVNIIMIFVWAFGGSVNVNKKSYAKAILIMALIGIGIAILLSIAGAGILRGVLSNLNTTYY